MQVNTSSIVTSIIRRSKFDFIRINICFDVSIISLSQDETVKRSIGILLAGRECSCRRPRMSGLGRRIAGQGAVIHSQHDESVHGVGGSLSGSSVCGAGIQVMERVLHRHVTRGSPIRSWIRGITGVMRVHIVRLERYTRAYSAELPIYAIETRTRKGAQCACPVQPRLSIACPTMYKRVYPVPLICSVDRSFPIASRKHHLSPTFLHFFSYYPVADSFHPDPNDVVSENREKI